MLVYEGVAEALVAEGTRTVFGLMGDGNLDLIPQLVHVHGIGYVSARHEHAAVAMADGAARSTGRPAVCTVTHGPGLTNAVTALRAARDYRSRVLLLAGDTPRGATHHFQEIDQALVGHAAGVRVHTVHDPATSGTVLRRAWRELETGGGPVLVNLPTDVQQQPLPASWRYEATPPPRPGVLEPADADIDEVAEMLRDAHRPVLLVGGGAVTADAREALLALSRRLGAPLATSLEAHGLFAGTPLNLGIAGGFGTPLCRRAFRAADVIVVLGASLNPYTTLQGELLAHARVAQVDVDPERFGWYVDVEVPVLGDARRCAERLLERLGPPTGAQDAAAEAMTAAIASHRPVVPDGDGALIDPRALFLTLEEALPADRTLVVDAGHFTTFAAGMLSVTAPRRFVPALGFGAVGHGLATAAGVAVALDGDPVTLVIGDGGLLMQPGELDTIVRHQLPVRIVVVNDEAFGQEVHMLTGRGWPTDTARLPSPDVAAIAEAYGIEGHTVRTPAELARVEALLSHRPGPLLLDVRVDPTVRNWRVAERLAGPGREAGEAQRA